MYVWWEPIILGSEASLAFGPIDTRLGLGNINRPHTPEPTRVRIRGKATASTESGWSNCSLRAALRFPHVVRTSEDLVRLV